MPLEEWNLLLSQHQPYVNSFGETGMQIRINQFDLSNIGIKNTSLTDSFITESVFRDNRFENVEIFDAKLCGCEFKNVMFSNINFVKTDLSFCVFVNCKFIDTKLKRCETNETIFADTQFISCDLFDVFSFSLLKNILFCDMDLRYLDFYQVMAEHITFRNIKGFNVDKAVISLNAGNFRNENIITGENAVEYFRKCCSFE